MPRRYEQYFPSLSRDEGSAKHKCQRKKVTPFEVAACPAKMQCDLRGLRSGCEQSVRTEFLVVHLRVRLELGSAHSSEDAVTNGRLNFSIDANTIA
jgi:hypothetical protein